MSFINLELGGTYGPAASHAVCWVYVYSMHCCEGWLLPLKITPLSAKFKLRLWVSFCLKPVYFGHPCAITHIPRVGASWLGCMGNESMENMRKWSEVRFTYGKCKLLIIVANM